MKKSKKIPLAVMLLHIAFCLFFSLDWPFLEGIYLGFWLTLAALYILTFPVATAALALICSVRNLRTKKSFFDGICAALGTLIGLTYLLSGLGFLKNSVGIELGNLILPYGTAILWGCWIGKWIFQKIKKKRKYT